MVIVAALFEEGNQFLFISSRGTSTDSTGNPYLPSGDDLTKNRPRIKGQHLVNFTDHEMAWQGQGITQRHLFLKDKKQ
jgi:hypothetical protein